MNPNEDQPQTPSPEATTPIPAPQSQPTPQPVSGEDPGKTLGIIGLVFAFLFPLIGLIISIVAKRKSSKAGHTNALALTGIILGAIFTVIGLIIGIFMIIVFSGLVAKCQELGPGTHYENGTTYTCN